MRNIVEQEYHFQVSSIKPYVDYCVHHGYHKRKETKEIRKLYQNGTDVVARITIDVERSETVLDFKEDCRFDAIHQGKTETLPLKVMKNNQEAIFSILSIFQYTLTTTFVRNRFVYELENVRIEIDQYLEPECYCMVTVEGKKETVTKVSIELQGIGK